MKDLDGPRHEHRRPKSNHTIRFSGISDDYFAGWMFRSA
jgi:hypothetical protein